MSLTSKKSFRFKSAYVSLKLNQMQHSFCKHHCIFWDVMLYVYVHFIAHNIK